MTTRNVPDATAAVLSDIEGERLRQIRKEGWTPEHDDEHELGELAIAAACYACHSSGNYEVNHVPGRGTTSGWKPSNPRRDLVKAGAMIVAEIERLDRAEREEDGE